MCKVTRNRLANCNNEFQGSHTKILTVCSAGLLRSPTIARVLVRDFDNVNTRAVGTSSDYALIPLDMVHLKWADLIISADIDIHMFVHAALREAELNTHCVHLGIPDMFSFASKELEKLIREELDLIRNLECEKGIFEFKLPEPSYDF